MTNSIQRSSPLGWSRLGDTRILTPYALRALDAWFMLRVWPDRHDQQSLVSIQNAVRRAVRKQPKPRLAKRPNEAVRLAYALDELTGMDYRRNQYHARHLFAVAALHQARLFKVTRPYDMLACYAGLVDMTFEKTEEHVAIYGDAPKPLELMSLVGGVVVESSILGHGPEGQERRAEMVAILVCAAISKHFPDTATDPRPVKSIAPETEDAEATA